MTDPIKAYLSEIGARGRAANSQAQAQASASNGKRGGRPINPNSKRQQKLKATR